MTSSVAPTVKRNGAKGSIETVELPLQQRLAVLRSAADYYQQHAYVNRYQKQIWAAELAETGMLAITHVAAVLGVTAKTIRRWEISVPGNRKGGAFDPAQLEHVAIALEAHQTTGTYNAQHIRKAYENGMSSPVLARLLGLSRKYVLQLIRKAEDGSWDLESREAAAGREEDRAASVDEGVWSFGDDDVDDNGHSAYERDILRRVALGEFDGLEEEHVVDEPVAHEPDPVDESGAVADEAGCDQHADDSADGGAEDRRTGAVAPADGSTPAGDEPD